MCYVLLDFVQKRRAGGASGNESIRAKSVIYVSGMVLRDNWCPENTISNMWRAKSSIYCYDYGDCFEWSNHRHEDSQ